MSSTRRYLLASSLARLIEKDRGGQLVIEGYFPERTGRSTYVRAEESSGQLVLVTHGSGGPMEEAIKISRTQADALLDVAADRVGYRRTRLSVGTHTVQISRFVMPGPLDVVSVTFENDAEARAFHLLPWLGAEITADPSYQNRSIAVAGLPAAPDVPVSDFALNSLLDVLEGQFDASLQQASAEPLIASLPPAPPMAAEISKPVGRAEKHGDLEIEDDITRELARALRPEA